MAIPLKVVKLRESGRIYRIERQGRWYLIELVEGETRTKIARIKGSYEAARETCRWHAKWSRGLR